MDDNGEESDAAAGEIAETVHPPGSDGKWV